MRGEASGTPILVTGAAGRVGRVGRTITELLLTQGQAVRAMVRHDDERAQNLRDLGAEIVVGDLLDLDSMHRAIAGCEAMYFGMSVSDTYLAATVNAAAVAKHHGVKAFVNLSQMTLAQMSIPVQQWRVALVERGLPGHLVSHLVTMAELHRAGRYDRLSDDVLTLTGQGPLDVQELVRRNAATFTTPGQETGAE